MTRLLAALLSLLACRPVVAICDHGKTYGLMKSMAQEAYALDLDRLDGDTLWRTFELLVANRDAARRDIVRHGFAIRVRLAGQYDRVFSILTSIRQSPRCRSPV